MSKKLSCVTLSILLCFCTLLMSAGPAFADAAGDWYTTKSVSYDINVTDPDGYVNIRYGPGTEYDIVTSAPKGTILHVENEALSSNGKTWCQVCYQGKYGWLALARVTIVKNTDSSALITTLYEGGTDTDYDASITAPDGGLNLRYGPGTNYDIRVPMMPNGTVLHIFKVANSANNRPWGCTSYNNVWGWVDLAEVTEISKEEPAPVIAEESEKDPEVSAQSEQETIDTDETVLDAANPQYDSSAQSDNTSRSSLMIAIPLVCIAVLLAAILLVLLKKKK